MCNINVLVKVGEGGELFSPFIAATETSYLTNGDGDGVYFDKNNTTIKGTDKLDLIPYEEIFRNSEFIISHQRLATSGLVNEEFAHPFANKEFVLVHNGVFHGLGDSKKSDTAVFFKNLWKAFQKFKSRLTRRKAIIKAIKETMEDTEGTASIALFDKVSRRLYYFKTTGTTISNVAGEIDGTRYLFLSTSYRNTEYFTHRTKKPVEYKIHPGEIYEIYISGKRIAVTVAGKFEENYGYGTKYYGGSGYYKTSGGYAETSYSTSMWDDYDDGSGETHTDDAYGKLLKIRWEDDIKEGKCEFCGEKLSKYGGSGVTAVYEHGKKVVCIYCADALAGLVGL